VANLILVRHAQPLVKPQVPSVQWRLTPAGREGASAMGHLLAAYNPTRVITSIEPKAVETGTIIADQVQVSTAQVQGLHEHERHNEGFVSDHPARVRELLSRPEELVYGAETGAQAADRFAHALYGAVGETPGQTVVAVSHGTVMVLFAAARAGIDAFVLWQSLKMPCALVFTLPDFVMQTPVPICLPKGNGPD